MSRAKVFDSQSGSCLIVDRTGRAYRMITLGVREQAGIGIINWMPGRRSILILHEKTAFLANAAVRLMDATVSI